MSMCNAWLAVNFPADHDAHVQAYWVEWEEIHPAGMNYDLDLGEELEPHTWVE